MALRSQEPKISRRVIRRVIEGLINTYEYTLEELDTFARTVNEIYRYGYVMEEGRKAYAEILYGVPMVQDLRLDILTTMHENFLLEGVTIEDMNAYIMQLFQPIYTDELLSRTYGIGIDIKILKSEDYIKTFGSNFILFMIFRTICTDLIRETSRLLQLQHDRIEEEQNELNKLNIKKKLMEPENEES